MIEFLAVLFVLLPLFILIFAVRGFVRDVRRRAHRREAANRRFAESRRRR